VYYTVIISLGGIPGFLMAAWLVERWGRKPVCVVTLLGGGVMAIVYGQSAVFGGNVGLLITSGLLMQFFLFGMWAVLYTYTPELYPTSARATGSGFASAIGRVGSLLGPLVTGLMFPITGQGGVFALGALCFAVAALVVWVFGMETKGKTLEELTQA
jgi:putative MFS transporter